MYSAKNRLYAVRGNGYYPVSKKEAVVYGSLGWKITDKFPVDKFITPLPYFSLWKRGKEVYAASSHEAEMVFASAGFRECSEPPTGEIPRIPGLLNHHIVDGEYVHVYNPTTDSVDIVPTENLLGVRYYITPCDEPGYENAQNYFAEVKYVPKIL